MFDQNYDTPRYKAICSHSRIHLTYENSFRVYVYNAINPYAPLSLHKHICIFNIASKTDGNEALVLPCLPVCVCVRILSIDFKHTHTQERQKQKIELNCSQRCVSFCLAHFRLLTLATCIKRLLKRTVGSSSRLPLINKIQNNSTGNDSVTELMKPGDVGDDNELPKIYRRNKSVQTNKIKSAYLLTLIYKSNLSFWNSTKIHLKWGPARCFLDTTQMLG